MREPESRSKSSGRKDVSQSRPNIPPKLPGILRKHHKALFAELREIATETHTLHRLWYKNQLQFRHMVWWRKLHGVRQMGMRITTGSLRDTVPSAGNLSESTRAHATESGLVNLDEDADILGAQFLYSLAQAYTTLWGQSAENWASLPRFSTPPTHHIKKSTYRAVLHTAIALRSALEKLRDKSCACFLYVANRLTEMLIQANSDPSKYPTSADACGNMYDDFKCMRAHGRGV